MNGLVFFFSAYLSPEIARYRPDLTNRWFAMQQATAAGIPIGRREEILNKVKSIFAARERAGNNTRETESSVDDLLAQAEKSPTTCQRDLIYARAVLQLSHKKEFKRAMTFAEKLDALDLRTQALQFVYYDMATAYIDTKTPAALEEALHNVERVTSPEQRGLLYMRMAASWRANGDRDRAYTLLLEAARSAERVAEPAVRAGLLFAAAYELVGLDPGLIQAIRMMKDAIHILNGDKDVKIDQISVLRRLEMGCERKNDTWYGSSDRLGRFDLIETLVKIASSDTDTAEALAGDLVGGQNRVRALAAIASSEMRAARAVTKGSARRRP